MRTTSGKSSPISPPPVTTRTGISQEFLVVWNSKVASAAHGPYDHATAQRLLHLAPAGARVVALSNGPDVVHLCALLIQAECWGEERSAHLLDHGVAHPGSRDRSALAAALHHVETAAGAEVRAEELAVVLVAHGFTIARH